MSHLDPLLKTFIAALSVLAGALATWIAARYGRKVMMQIRSGDREVKIEAQTPEQAQQMLRAAEDYQKRDSDS